MAKYVAIMIVISIVVIIYSVLPGSYKKQSEDIRQMLYEKGSLEELTEWYNDLDLNNYNDAKDDEEFYYSRNKWPNVVKDLKPAYVICRKKPKIVILQIGGGLSNPHGIIMSDDIKYVEELYQGDYILEVNSNIVVWYKLYKDK